MLVAKAPRVSVHRASNLAARYGGEEFAILLPQTKLANALDVAKRALEAIQSLQIKNHTNWRTPDRQHWRIYF